VSAESKAASMPDFVSSPFKNTDFVDTSSFSFHFHFIQSSVLRPVGCYRNLKGACFAKVQIKGDAAERALCHDCTLQQDLYFKATSTYVQLKAGTRTDLHIPNGNYIKIFSDLESLQSPQRRGRHARNPAPSL